MAVLLSAFKEEVRRLDIGMAEDQRGHFSQFSAISSR
jgi:hypothetical protein